MIAFDNNQLLIFLSLHLISAVFANNYHPTEEILLDCGASSNGSDSTGRKWTTDVGSPFALSSFNSHIAVATSQSPDIEQVPYMTARIFQTQYTYSFPVIPGRKFLRLYFYPNSYSHFNTSNSIFSVKAGPYTLLNNFSAYQTAQALSVHYLVKEYSIYVDADSFILTFIPNTWVFINGIEVTSMPPSLYDDPGAIITGQSGTFPVNNSTALENMYRLNVGGNVISPTNDTGLFRTWLMDDPYIFGAASGVTISLEQGLTIEYPSSVPSYVAPVDVYYTARSMGPNARVNLNYNLTWLFSVDAGFAYLVRLHFCEVVKIFGSAGKRVFDIYLNNETAEAEVDVAAWAKGSGKPVFKDYVVINTGETDLWLSLHPNTKDNPEYYDALLNGVEIFKMSDSFSNLAGPNPVLESVDSSRGESIRRGSKRHWKDIIGGIVGGGVALFLAFVGLVVCVVKCCHRRQSRQSPISHSTRQFSFLEIQEATNSFDEALLLGIGGFGKVYKGEFDGGRTIVAIKRGSPLSEQGVHEFRTEIELLSKVRHRHLVSLLGYCDENGEMVLVYDYMAYGTLREHLYKTEKPPLQWKQRLEICIGAARGLLHLHTGADHTIIHRDIKTTNILLDENWVAKVSDFGLSKLGPSLDETHVSTIVKGSFGYLDPDYFRLQQLTVKSDVYSFGVVLFEVLCARPALNHTLPGEQVSLAEWASRCQKKGILDQIIDPYLKGKIVPECFRKYAETAMKCVSEERDERPSMGDVLWDLEFALRLQKSAEESGEVRCEEGDVLWNVPNEFSSIVTDSRSAVSVVSEDSNGLTASDVFSHIRNPRGR